MWFGRLNESIEDRGAVQEFLIVWFALAIALTVVGTYVIGRSLDDAASFAVLCATGIAIVIAFNRPLRSNAERNARNATKPQREEH
jgi:hypothetical protein